MIRCLRRKHFIIMLLLAVLLPVLFALGLLARRPVAVMENLPDALTTGRGVPNEP